MPIAFAPAGEVLTVRRISGDDKVRKHLQSLGIVPDHPIMVLEQIRGSTIVLVNEMRLALDRNVALTIMVD